MKLSVWLTGAALLSLVGPAASQTVQAGPLTLDFTGRAQVQFNTTSVDASALPLGVDEPASSVFELRRIRFGTELDYEGWLSGKIELDLAYSARLADAFVDVAFSEAVALRAGQFKRPFSRIELTSSTRTLTIERGVRIRGLEDVGAIPGEEYFLLDEGMYAGRDVGAEIHGAAGGFGYAAGIFSGEGANRREERGSKAYAARATYRPIAPLEVGMAWTRQPTGPLDPLEGEIEGTAWSVDAEWGRFRAPGLHVLGEVVIGDDPLVMAGGEPAAMVGAQVVAGWFMAREGRVEGVEPVFRASYGDPDTDAGGDHGVLVTPGLNLYFTGRNRLMFNGDIYFPGQDGLETQYALIAQLQVYF